MNFANLFIQRPVMTILVMFSILLAGLMGYRLLPVSDLPNVDRPTIAVSANLPGASPETMGTSVATVLEREFSTIAGLESMNSSSSQGQTQINLQFELDRDIDAAAQDVQAAISKTLGQLPPDMPNPPTFKKTNPADQPVLYLALISDVLPLSTVNEYADTFVAQRISMISGVAQVQIFGPQKYAVRVQVDPNKMAARGVGIDEVAAAIRNGNVNLPTGELEGRHRAFTVQSEGQLKTAGEYRPLIVSYRNGSPIRLGELGTVIDSVENDKTASWYGTPEKLTRSIIISIQRQPGTNTVKVVDAIKELLPTFKAQMPASIEMPILYDRSRSIRESVHDVKFTLYLTIGLVILVIFLFLRSLTATIIPSLALPMSLIGTFAVMYMLDYSVNNLSLMALTLSVGFVVDDAIVVLENIVRHRENGENAWDAAINGSREIGFTIISMTISLAAVFIPVFFMGGMLGRLLHEFSVTIAVAILISGFISLSLTPMLCSRFLRHHESGHHGRLYRASEWVFNGMLRGYDWSLKIVMRHHVIMMLISVGLLFLTIYMFKVMPKGFIPSEDASQIIINTEAQQGVSPREMMDKQQELARILQKLPNVNSFTSIASGGNTGRLFARLKSPRERNPKQTVDEIMAAWRPLLGQVPGIIAVPQNPPPIRIESQFSRAQYQFAMQSPDLQELYEYAPKMEAKMRELPGLIDVSSDLKIKNPQLNIEIDRDKSSAHGITARQIQDALYTAYGSRQVSTFFTPAATYQVILELEPKYQSDPSVFSSLYVRSEKGDLIPLSTIAKTRQDVGPLSVNHIGQLPSVTISFNLKPGTALGNAVEGVNNLADSVLPESVTTSFQGSAREFERSMTGLWVLILAAILVIYIILGILYESFIHPITILSGLPSAGVGALLTLMLFDMELNLYAFVGIIMLIGIVKKNAIMMIDFALEAQRNEGKTPAQAIYEGALVRFRPIMMTTMAALMGGIPIAIGYGAGGDSRRPLGLAIVGGLIFSQLLTLYITPVFYTYMERARHLFSRKKHKAEEHAPQPTGVPEFE